MSRQLNPAQIWSQLPVASRTVEVNTKTGFSLTAGSYSVRVSSTLQGYGNNNGATTVNTTISAVTMAKTVVASGGQYSNYSTPGEGAGAVHLSSTTNIQSYKGSATGQCVCGYSLVELY